MANITVRQPSESRPAAPMAFDPFRMFQEMMGFDPFALLRQGGEGRGFLPEVEVRETADQYVFSVDLPGLEEKDVEVTVTGHQLRITGQREAESRQEGDTYYTYERRYGSFSRSFQLPEGAHVDDVQAELRNGVLTVSVPKRAELKARKISIKGMVDKLKKLGSGDKPNA